MIHQSVMREQLHIYLVWLSLHHSHSALWDIYQWGWQVISHTCAFTCHLLIMLSLLWCGVCVRDHEVGEHTCTLGSRFCWDHVCNGQQPELVQRWTERSEEGQREGRDEVYHCSEEWPALTSSVVWIREKLRETNAQPAQTEQSCSAHTCKRRAQVASDGTVLLAYLTAGRYRQEESCGQGIWSSNASHHDIQIPAITRHYKWGL